MVCELAEHHSVPLNNSMKLMIYCTKILDQLFVGSLSLYAQNYLDTIFYVTFQKKLDLSTILHIVIVFIELKLTEITQLRVATNVQLLQTTLFQQIFSKLFSNISIANYQSLFFYYVYDALLQIRITSGQFHPREKFQNPSGSVKIHYMHLQRCIFLFLPTI